MDSEADDGRRYRRETLPVPRAAAGEYEANLERALRDPVRRENYERYRRAQRGERVDYLPIKMDIENVSRCNFRCAMCQVSEWPRWQRADDMSLEDFKAVLDDQPGVYEIKLQGMGEPLLGGERFFDMVREARARDIWVRTTLNGSLLHRNDNYRKVIDSGINEVQVSIDGATRETFESIRIGGKFDKVKANCRLLNDYDRSRGRLTTRMWVMIQKGNVGEFLDFVPVAAEMGFRRLTYSLSLHGWGQQEWGERNRERTVETDVTPELAWRAVEMGRGLGVEVTFWNTTEKYVAGDRERCCPWPFERAFISSDLRIVPCCMIGNPQVLDLGDARRFREIWFGEPYEQFRRAHLKGDIPGPCQWCYQ